MSLLIGTDLGVYRAVDIPFTEDDVERVLDCGKVTSVRSFDHTPGVYVSSKSGAFRTTDSGDSWEDLTVPQGDRYWFSNEDRIVFSILATADGDLYAGTNDPYLYRSADDGKTWRELREFRRLPSFGLWESPLDPHNARVRSLDCVPGRPDHLVVGVEAGGVHVSKDGGRSWIDKHESSPTDDIHHVLPLDPDVYIAATGHLDLDLEHLDLGHAVGEGGVYRTTDSGESWTRLDSGNECSYIRRVFAHEGVLYFCGANGSPPAWADEQHESALLESIDFGRTFKRVDYPSAPEIIEAWTTMEGEVICGSGFYNAPNHPKNRHGHVMRRLDGEYEVIGTTPSNVSGLEYVE